jgi:hypothetical protein
MRIRHTVVFTFYDTTTKEQIEEVIRRLNEMGKYLTSELGVTEWVVAKHIPDTFKPRRAHLLQDGVFPSLEAMEMHAKSAEHARVIELTPQVCDWMTIDTTIPDPE